MFSNQGFFFSIVWAENNVKTSPFLFSFLKNFGVVTIAYCEMVMVSDIGLDDCFIGLNEVHRVDL